MAEIWDLYNSKKELLGRTTERGKQLQEGEYNVVVEIWTINSQKQILITRRHPEKKAGGLWEFTGGGVIAGETSIIAAKRELYEEVGIKVDETTLKLFQTDTYKNYIMDIYLAFNDFDVSSLKLQPSEVIDAKWVTFDELKDMCTKDLMVRSVAARFFKYEDALNKITQ